MSPKTMAALENSPARDGRRRSSGGSLRPVIPLSLDDASNESALDDEGDGDEIPIVGPVPKSPGSFASAGGVDEVEAVFG
jgi:hypothetical protein